MINLKMKLAIIGSLLTLSAWQLDAFASNGEFLSNDIYDQQNIRPVSIPMTTDITLGVIDTSENSSARILQTEFLPLVKVGDIKRSLAGYFCEKASPCLLALVCKAWHQFFLGTAFEAKQKEDITQILYESRNNLAQQYMRRWWAQRDRQILEAGIFRHQPDQPEGAPLIEIKLSTMRETNGDLVLPDELEMLHLCFTEKTETFISPPADNIFRILVYADTLSHLKQVASQLSADELFTQSISQADLSQHAVCVLIRFGANSGFRWAIMKFRDLNSSSLWDIHTKIAVKQLDNGAPFPFTGSKRSWIVFNNNN